METTGQQPQVSDEGFRRALFLAQSKVQAALKRGYNKHHDYAYASAEDVVAAGKKAMWLAGLTMEPAPAPREAMEFVPAASAPDTNGGATGWLRFWYRVTHVESGYFREYQAMMPVVPTAGSSKGWARPADKASTASETEARGYFLISLLMIPRRDPNEIPARKDESDGQGEDTNRSDFPRVSPQDAISRLSTAAQFSDAASIYNHARAYVLQHPEEDGVGPKVETAFVTASMRIFDGYKTAAQVAKARALLTKTQLTPDARRAVVAKIDEVAIAITRGG